MAAPAIRHKNKTMADERDSVNEKSRNTIELRQFTTAFERLRRYKLMQRSSF